LYNHRSKNASALPLESGGVSLVSHKKNLPNALAYTEPTLQTSSAGLEMSRLRTWKSWRAGWRFLSRLCLLSMEWISKAEARAIHFYAAVFIFVQKRIVQSHLPDLPVE